MLTAVTSRVATAGTQSELPSFGVAVEMHKAMVYSIAWHLLHDRAAADELAQDVFLKLHQHWTGIQSAEHLLFWLRRTTTHRAIDAARKRKAQAETSLDESDEPTVLEQVHDSMLSSYLARMVGTLPEKQRVAVVLRYQEDMEIEEIAKVLDLNASTVKTHIARGLEMLREKVHRRLGRERET